MKKFLKWGGIALIIIIVLAVIGGGGKSSNSTNSTGNSGQAQEQPKTPEMVTAQQIADDFDGNQVTAEKTWNGKFVQFTATVSNITDTGLSFTNVASKQFSMAQISCKVKDTQQLLSLKNGESVTVNGVIGKQTIGVIDMSDCEVVK
ncbi:MAG: hypothetical protein AAB553_01335 [Patescibacteria group bacterium]